MNLTKLKWIKNVKDSSGEREWAYINESMELPQAKIFRLRWRILKYRDNAQKPRKDDLMLLLQKAKVTHIVEFLDNEVYEGSGNEWTLYRIVKAIYIGKKDVSWDDLPHQREFFKFDNVVYDGKAHCLDDKNKMPQFHKHWDSKNGLREFQNHVTNKFNEYSQQFEYSR